MKVEQMPRVFRWNKKEYADPNPNFTINQVADHYAGLYPEWCTAKITQKGPENGKLVFEVTSDFKDKG